MADERQTQASRRRIAAGVRRGGAFDQPRVERQSLVAKDQVKCQRLDFAVQINVAGGPVGIGMAADVYKKFFSGELQSQDIPGAKSRDSGQFTNMPLDYLQKAAIRRNMQLGLKRFYSRLPVRMPAVFIKCILPPASAGIACAFKKSR